MVYSASSLIHDQARAPGSARCSRRPGMGEVLRPGTRPPTKVFGRRSTGSRLATESGPGLRRALGLTARFFLPSAVPGHCGASVERDRRLHQDQTYNGKAPSATYAGRSQYENVTRKGGKEDADGAYLPFTHPDGRKKMTNGAIEDRRERQGERRSASTSAACRRLPH